MGAEADGGSAGIDMIEADEAQKEAEQEERGMFSYTVALSHIAHYLWR